MCVFLFVRFFGYEVYSCFGRRFIRIKVFLYILISFYNLGSRDTGNAESLNYVVVVVVVLVQTDL